MARRLLKEHIKILFAETKKSPYWEKIKKLPLILRYTVGIFFMLFGILGIFTPIPAGFVFFLIGLAIFVGLGRTKSLLLTCIYFTRIHLVYAKIYTWWHTRKR